MRQLLILSGKGGTGKTTVAAAFVRLLAARAYADCDVDAPNLHLALGQQGQPQREEFFGLPVAEVQPEVCTGCGLCQQHCRFGALAPREGIMAVNAFACEGCGVCEAVCPSRAVTLKEAAAGEMMLYLGDDAVFSTARLHMGKGTSGLLVSQVKKRMKDAAPPDTDVAVIDGSPGIGCPVIASLSGVDMALIVAEPSVSGISDMGRILKTARHFGVPTAVCVNKYDTNPGNTQQIEQFCREEGLPFAGRIPYDPQVVEAVNSGRSIVDTPCPSGEAVQQVFCRTIQWLKGGLP